MCENSVLGFDGFKSSERRFIQRVYRGANVRGARKRFALQFAPDLWANFLPLTKVLMVAAQPFIKAPSLRRLHPNDVNGETRRVKHSFSHSLSAHN